MLKSLIHKAIQSIGYDIVSARNLEGEVNRRIKERDLRRLTEIQQLRQQRSQTTPVSGTGVVWVNRDEIMLRASAAMHDVNTLLDIGCAFRPQQYFDAKIHICCEPCEEYMNRLTVETAMNQRYVYLKADIEAVCDAFPHKSVDSAYLCDVIEHIDRDLAVKCLAKLQEIVKRQLILFTPIGFMPQDPDEAHAKTDPWGMGGMEWQKHRSGWTPDEFPAEKGWTVIACRDFHQEDGYGRPLAKPFGAMWAIWNDSGNQNNRSETQGAVEVK